MPRDLRGSTSDGFLLCDASSSRHLKSLRNFVRANEPPVTVVDFFRKSVRTGTMRPEVGRPRFGRLAHRGRTGCRSDLRRTPSQSLD